MLNNIYKKLFLDKNGKLVVVQFPNMPIIIWVSSIIINYFINNPTVNSIISSIGSISLIIWALLEVASGVNLFRKLLGLTVLIFILIKFFI